MPAPLDILQFIRGQLFHTPQLPDVSFAGKTVVVTGANSGLGLECAKQLIHLNVSTLILGCRNVSKGEAAKKEIIGGKGSAANVQVWEVDMANYASVKSFANRISKELPRLDAFLANAGISTNEYHVAENLEQTLTVNVVSTFLVSLLCLPVLEETARQNGSSTHLTIVGSNVHAFADPTSIIQPPQGKVFSTLSDEKHADMARRYFLSKLIVMLCVQEMATCLSSESTSGRWSVVVNCPSPGWCKTPLFRQDDGGAVGRTMLRLIGRTGEVGARTLTSAIAAGPKTHGKYVSECQVKNTSVWVRSEEGKETQRKVWAELIDTLNHISPGVGDVLI